MPAGRPTKLTPELLGKAKTYLSTCVDSIDYTDKGALNFVRVELPTLVGFALYLGINKDTVNEWCKPKPIEVLPEKSEDIVPDGMTESSLRYEFSVLVKEIVQEQEKRTLNNAMGGLYNPKIAALVLGRYGYTEKTETDVTTKGEKITQGGMEDIEAIAKRVSEELKQKKMESESLSTIQTKE